VPLYVPVIPPPSPDQSLFSLRGEVRSPPPPPPSSKKWPIKTKHIEKRIVVQDVNRCSIWFRWFVVRGSSQVAKHNMAGKGGVPPWFLIDTLTGFFGASKGKIRHAGGLSLTRTSWFSVTLTLVGPVNHCRCTAAYLHQCHSGDHSKPLRV
jgi:hypothetical protein